MWLLRFALLLGSGDALLAPAAARRLPTRMSLAGSTYRINLDFGRETGTWMPPRWAATSGRTEFTLDLAFEDDGVATVASLARPLRGLALATQTRLPIESATWRVDSDKSGSTLRCVLAHTGLSISDCILEAGDLYLSIPFFPTLTVSSKEGLLSIIAYRFVVRKERRLVGVFFAEGPLEDKK